MGPRTAFRFRWPQRLHPTQLFGAGAFAAVLLLGAASSAPEPPMRQVPSTPEKVAEGSALFATCAACHGASGEGRVGIGPRLRSESFLAAASDDFLLRTITKGRAGTTMIPWGASLEPEQIESLVAFIRSWKVVEPAELDESPLRGDPQAGARVFESICAACHGRSGGGYQESANGTGIGRKAFLSEASNGYLRYVIHKGKSQTPMRPFAADSEVAVANLTDAQIEDVIAYLRAHAW